MKRYFKFLYEHIMFLLTILLVGFFAPVVVTEIINNNVAYYQASFTVESIDQFDHEKLINEEFLNQIKSSGANDKYINIDVEKMLKKKHFTYTIIDNTITIESKIKYYDNFFISSSASVGTRAKMFIKDSVLSIAGKDNSITFEDEKNIVSLHKYTNKWNVGLVGLIATFLLEIIASIIIFVYKKDKINKEKFEYDNKTIFAHCFYKEYWKLSTKPLVKVKDITIIAMLFALMLVCKLIPIPSGFGNLGLGLTYLFFAITAMVYGPVYGFIIGIFSDILGFFLFPSSGIFHLGYTLQAALTGFIYGLCFYKSKISFTKVLVCRTIINLLINSVYGSFLYILVFYPDQTDRFKELFISYMTLLSLPKNLVYLLPQSLLLYYVIKVTLPILNRFKLVDKQMIIKNK